MFSAIVVCVDRPSVVMLSIILCLYVGAGYCYAEGHNPLKFLDATFCKTSHCFC